MHDALRWPAGCHPFRSSIDVQAQDIPLACRLGFLDRSMPITGNELIRLAGLTWAALKAMFASRVAPEVGASAFRCTHRHGCHLVQQGQACGAAQVGHLAKASRASLPSQP